MDLGEVGRLPFGNDCKQELIVFGGGVEPTTATIANPSLPGMTVTLKPARDLQITVWIVENVLTATEVESQIAVTRSLYIDHGTGLLIHATVKPFPPLASPPLPNKLLDLDENASCALASTLADPANKGVYDADRINVYYVRGFTASAGSPMALTCFGAPYDHPEMIFVDGDILSAPYLLAHEIGHALGLQRSAPIPNGGGSTYPGHSDELNLSPYLRSDNLMQNGATFVNQITVGEIYRMHFDELSWLWHGRTPAGGYPRTCQNSPVTGGKCAPFTIQPPGGWP
ncbi:MAG: hypothetical protein ACREOQ_18535 [Gemmatimonadales bacterium]